MTEEKVYTKDIKDVVKEEKPKEEKPKKEQKHIWNSWVKENKNKIKDNSSYRVIGKFRYIFLMFILALFLIAFTLGGIFLLSTTGSFKSVINNTNLCSCPALPSIPACPQMNCPMCNCPSIPACNNNCSISVPSNLNVIVKNSSG